MKTSEAIALGWLFGVLFFGVAVFISTEFGPTKTMVRECRKQNNVYDCQLIAVPKAKE
jgi:hypothetical protein